MKSGEHYAPMKLVHHPDPEIRYVAVKVDCPCGQLDCPINNRGKKLDKEKDIMGAFAAFTMILVSALLLWYFG